VLYQLMPFFLSRVKILSSRVFYLERESCTLALKMLLIKRFTVKMLVLL